MSSRHRALLGLPVLGPLHVSQVRNPYKQAALEWHPDRNEPARKDECDERFKQIGEAFETLLHEALADQDHGEPTADRPAEQRPTDDEASHKPSKTTRVT